LPLPLSPQNLLRKKKRKLKPSQPPPLQPPNLPQLRQQRLPKVSLQRKSQLKQTQKPLHQPQSNLDEDDDFVVNDEVTFGRNRRSLEFGKVVDDDELSDYVKDRLSAARELALEAYRKAQI
jgi:hypothetical protein